jgi:metallophosphoesterase superfamily enzyme
MDRHVYNTLILSDLHLGVETSRAREATRVLKENRFERFILVGDIFAELCAAHQGTLEVSWLYPEALKSQTQY